MAGVAAQITSLDELNRLKASTRVVVVNFYSEQNDASKAIEPVFAQIATQLSRSGRTAFVKVDAERQTEIAQHFEIDNPPMFVIFRDGETLSKISGANPQQLLDSIKRSAEQEQEQSQPSGQAEQAGSWIGAGLPRGYNDVTDQVDVRGLDLLNADSTFGGVRTLFDKSGPSSASNGKGAASSSATKDWVESDVDEQLMLYVPFTATLKVHTIHITSLPPISEDDDVPMRPKTIHIYTNRQHNLDFTEAEDVPATQIIELKDTDWDKQTGTAKLELRFVKFQNISSLVLFVVDGDGSSSEKTRIDRIRFIGETGEKREMGKLEKIGADD